MCRQPAIKMCLKCSLVRSTGFFKVTCVHGRKDPNGTLVTTNDITNILHLIATTLVLYIFSGATSLTVNIAALIDQVMIAPDLQSKRMNTNGI